MWLIIILGIIAFLLIEHAIVFWLVFVPLAILFIASVVGIFRQRGSQLSHVASVVGLFIVMIVLLVVVCIP